VAATAAPDNRIKHIFMIIGITGLSGAGKDTVAEYLEQKGFAHASLSDVIREEAENQGIEFTRENLIRLGNELRKARGGEYLAKGAVEKVQASGVKNLVLTSIRHPAELEFFRKLPDFKLWEVSAPQDLRWQRAKNKLNSEDVGDFEDFKKWESFENSKNENRQQLSAVGSKADAEIINDKSLAELHRVVDELLEEEIYKLNQEK